MFKKKRDYCLQLKIYIKKYNPDIIIIILLVST